MLPPKNTPINARIGKRVPIWRLGSSTPGLFPRGSFSDGESTTSGRDDGECGYLSWGRWPRAWPVVRGGSGADAGYRFREITGSIFGENTPGGGDAAYGSQPRKSRNPGVVTGERPWKNVQDCKEVNSYHTYHPVMPAQECATKRIPVCPSTWETVHQLRKPGQTFDDVINELIRKNSETRLIEETQRIRKRNTFVPLSGL